MNDDTRFERLFEDGLHEIAPLRAPDRLRTQVKTESSRVHPRPRWLALIKEPPMRTNSHLAVGSPIARVAAIMVATLLIAAMVIGASFAGAQIFAANGPIIVDQSGDGTYTTITEAVAMAEDGDEILVRPGTYTEAVVIEKDITLTGDGPVADIVITAPDDGPTAQIAPRWGSATDPYAVLLLETNAVLSGLTFQGVRSEIHATGGSPTISGLVLEGVGLPYRGGANAAGSGILVNVGSAATISDNVMNGGGPIGIFDPSELTVDGNTLVDGPHIWGYLGDETVIRGNTISGALVRGINLSDDSSPLIEGNTITDAGQVGIRLRAADSPVVSGNTITGSGSQGIFVNTGTPILSGNSLSDNQTGIGWSGASGLIEGNTVTGGTTGISVMSGSPSLEDNATTGAGGFGIVISAGTSPTLTGNTSCENEQNLWVDDTANPVIADDNEICEDAPAE